MHALLIVALTWGATEGDAWPAFRGTGNSISAADSLPLTWSTDSGIAWKAPLAGYGQSSPVVWGDRVFVTSAQGENKERALVAAFDLKTGRKLWQEPFAAAQTVEVSNYVSRAAPTPAVDSKRVYAFFETGNLVALSHDGQVQWQRSLVDDYGKFGGHHGLGCSIALSEKSVILLVDHDGPSYLLAADKATGETTWKVDRPANVSWTSPIVAGDRILVSSSGSCAEFDLASGKQIWQVGGLDGNSVPSATVADELVLVSSSEVKSNIAIRRGGQGDVSQSHIAWHSNGASATFSSALAYQGHVYMVNRAGVAFCLDQESGKEVWARRIGESCWASPIGGCGRVYFFGKSGKTTVVDAKPPLQVLAENELPTEDRVYGVAAVDGRFVVRTGSTLLCVADPAQTPNKKAGSPMASSGDAKPKTTDADPAGFPDLPRAVTSFGAAVIGDQVYVYGGHHGRAHHYYDKGQSGELLRLSLKSPAKWEVAATGPRLQGLALVAHDAVLYRLGGFDARNDEDEEQDLWSLPEFAKLDPKTNKWIPLPPMPVARSSFDAVVAGDTLYVAGGWAMQGDKDAIWHNSAYAWNFAAESPKWRELPPIPSPRRAISLGTQGGKVYVVGGIQPEGKVTRTTLVYDVEANRWSDGPELPGEDMDGFGTAACNSGGRLYVSTASARLLRLSEDGQNWEQVRKLNDGRFFHRMLPIEQKRLLLIGGANMQRGKYASVEAVRLP